MDQYIVVAANGQEYGPCDLSTLLQWIREKRVAAATPIRKNGAVAVAAEFLADTAAAFRPDESTATPAVVQPSTAAPQRPPDAPATAEPVTPLPPAPRVATTPAFCTRCGVQVGSGTAFCRACGTPVAAKPRTASGSAGGWLPPSSGSPALGISVPGRTATIPSEFTVSGTIGQAWDLVQPHWLPLGAIFLLASLPGIVYQLIPVTGAALVAIVLAGPLALTCSRIMLAVIDGETPRVEMLFQRIGDRFAQGLLAYLAILVGVTLGSVLCIVPGLILFAMWSLTYMHLAASQDDFWAAMKRSAELTQGYRLKIWLMFLAFIPLMILGMLAFCVGLFVAMAIGQMSFALTYRFLLAQEAARGGAARS